MSPDDPIYDPVRDIAASTRALVANLERLDANLERLTVNTQDTKDLMRASLRVERALGWGVIVAVSVVLVVLVVLTVHVL